MVSDTADSLLALALVGLGEIFGETWQQRLGTKQPDA
jgi:hypothetical protein